MAYAIIKPEQLIEKFQYALDNKWGYIWGAAGGTWTQAKQNAATRKQTVEYGQRWVGHRVADCSGLYAWAFKELQSYMYHGSNTMWNKYCTAKGELRNGKREDGKPLKPGTAVFVCKDGSNRSHVGLYVGGDTVIEAASTQSGVITSKITNKKWSEWGELKYVDYGDAPQPQPEPEPSPTQRLIRYGCKGDDVKQVQQLLKDAGYLTGNVDGIFGKETLAAVKNFQGSRGLTADGIVGPKTLEALKKVPAIQRYTVTIKGIPEIDVSMLKGMYPNLTVAKE